MKRGTISIIDHMVKNIIAVSVLSKLGEIGRIYSAGTKNLSWNTK